jgi:hypothetical protein
MVNYKTPWPAAIVSLGLLVTIATDLAEAH